MPVKRASGLADLIAGGGLMGKREAAQPPAFPAAPAALPAARASRPRTASVAGRGGAENRAPDNTGRPTPRSRPQSARVVPRKEPAAAAVDDAGVQRPERHLGDTAASASRAELSDRPEGGVRAGGGLVRRGSKPVEPTPVAPVSAKAWSSEVRVNPSPSGQALWTGLWATGGWTFAHHQSEPYAVCSRRGLVAAGWVLQTMMSWASH